MLADRLKCVLPELISPAQNAFIPNRFIGDNIFIAQDICHGYHIDSGTLRCTIKLDIHKGFDSLNWEFLSTLHRIKFSDIFISRVRTCLSSSMCSIKIDGGPERFFVGKSGLRQGDILSPTFFHYNVNFYNKNEDITD